MGFYIEDPANGKAKFIETKYDGMIIPQPTSFDKVPESMALICVVDNGSFEAAGYCFDEREFGAFTHPDPRHKTWLLMNKKKAEELSGFTSQSKCR